MLAAAAACRGAAMQSTTGADSALSSNEMSSSPSPITLPVPFPIFDGTSAFVSPDALRGVMILDATSATALDAATFFPKK